MITRKIILNSEVVDANTNYSGHIDASYDGYTAIGIVGFNTNYSIVFPVAVYVRDNSVYYILRNTNSAAITLIGSFVYVLYCKNDFSPDIIH